MEQSITQPESKRQFINVYILFILCLLDTILTDIGLRNHIIGEANPLMSWIYSSSKIAFYLMKLALPVALIVILSKMRATLLINLLLRAALVIYSIVFLMHISWIVSVLALSI